MRGGSKGSKAWKTVVYYLSTPTDTFTIDHTKREQATKTVVWVSSATQVKPVHKQVVELALAAARTRFGLPPAPPSVQGKDAAQLDAVSTARPLLSPLTEGCEGARGGGAIMGAEAAGPPPTSCVCNVCQREQGPAAYSKKKWKKVQRGAVHKIICLMCTKTAELLQAKPPRFESFRGD
jgi:hypothetical protein